VTFSPILYALLPSKISAHKIPHLGKKHSNDDKKKLEIESKLTR